MVPQNDFSPEGSALFPRDAHAAIIVAHPDDETLWAGGLILLHPTWRWTIVTLCRKSDPDRAPRFFRVIERYGARGGMSDMDDGPEQLPLRPADIEREVLDVLPASQYDFIFTHSPRGEYTRHARHEEISNTVSLLWRENRISTRELWMFAYEDGEKKYFPKAVEHADVKLELPADVWKEKYRIITNAYGFTPDSWEAKTTPPVEAFWRFRAPGDVDRWRVREGRSR